MIHLIAQAKNLDVALVPCFPLTTPSKPCTILVFCHQNIPQIYPLFSTFTITTLAQVTIISHLEKRSSILNGAFCNLRNSSQKHEKVLEIAVIAVQ